MDKNNIHLKIANALLEERELANGICNAIYYALDALDAQLMRDLTIKIQNAEYSDEDLCSIRSYIHSRMESVAKLLGVLDYNPNGCTGEQTYKFIQDFTQVTSVKSDFSEIEISNYSQGEFNALTEDNSEDYYTEKCYHEFTASGGCRD